MEHRVYTYDQRHAFQSPDDYLYKAEVQPEVLEAGQFVVGYSDESPEHAAERCVAACRALGIGGHFAVDLDEMEAPADTR